MKSYSEKEIEDSFYKDTSFGGGGLRGAIVAYYIVEMFTYYKTRRISLFTKLNSLSLPTATA